VGTGNPQRNPIDLFRHELLRHVFGLDPQAIVHIIIQRTMLRFETFERTGDRRLHIDR